MPRARCALSVLTRCFERCSVAQPFDGPPLRGNALNIVLAPQGWLVVVAWYTCSGTCMYAMAVQAVHMQWYMHAVV